MIYAARVKQSGKGRGKIGRVIFAIHTNPASIKNRLEAINVSLGEKKEVYNLATLTYLPIEDVRSRMRSKQERKDLRRAIERVTSASGSAPYFLEHQRPIQTARSNGSMEGISQDFEEGGDDGRCES